MYDRVHVPRLALEDETIVLKVAVPLPDLVEVSSLRRLSNRVARSDAQKMPGSHPHKRGADDRNEKA